MRITIYTMLIRIPSYCGGGPSFSLYNDKDHNSIIFFTASKSKRIPTVSGAVPPVQRRVEAKHPVDDRLVISKDPAQNVDVLSKDPLSRGPDFVNVAEGNFCQMSTKTLHPVCTDKTADNCFNMKTQKLVVGGVSIRDTEYHKVIDWTDGS